MACQVLGRAEKAGAEQQQHQGGAINRRPHQKGSEALQAQEIHKSHDTGTERDSHEQVWHVRQAAACFHEARDHLALGTGLHRSLHRVVPGHVRHAVSRTDHPGGVRVHEHLLLDDRGDRLLRGPRAHLLRRDFGRHRAEHLCREDRGAGRHADRRGHAQARGHAHGRLRLPAPEEEGRVRNVRVHAADLPLVVDAVGQPVQVPVLASVLHDVPHAPKKGPEKQAA
mmetsp:Transcript_74516/g.213564  ORF Transcript_74516/g.213564 Transcript_74516/m.213564 type:complete len:226 (+) Transcript_74516:1210-1887(+)